MRRARSPSIKNKLMLAIVLTSTVTLLLASILFSVNALIGVRRSVIRDIRSLAGILAYLGRKPLQERDSDTAGWCV